MKPLRTFSPTLLCGFARNKKGLDFYIFGLEDNLSLSAKICGLFCVYLREKVAQNELAISKK